MHNSGVDLDDIVAFVKVVQAGSFSQAARLLGMSDLLETSRRALATHRWFSERGACIERPHRG
jgi:hypothetical protein